MDTIRLRWGLKSSWGECSTAKSRITCDNVNGNTTLSEVQGVFLQITFGMRVNLTAKAMGLRVANSHTGNHCEDGFIPLETIRRFLGVIRSRSHLSSKGRPLSQRGGFIEEEVEVEVDIEVEDKNQRIRRSRRSQSHQT
ncbi:hypothetical protein Tco_0937366 [Tanacetum coccineum]|uniref:Uncharacterized protein n=1 Tax=Tanacetum coccineum TaxID=301880 RepID=A0ABQ5DGV9_9ASTR